MATKGFLSAGDPPPPCKHHWVFQGLVYWVGGELPGSSARGRAYADRYYCRHCLAYRDANEREHGTTYQPVLLGAIPR